MITEADIYPKYVVRKLIAHWDQLNRLPTETAAELDALLPSILDRAFKGRL